MTLPAELVAQLDVALRVVGSNKNAWIRRQILLGAAGLAAEAVEFRQRVNGRRV